MKQSICAFTVICSFAFSIPALAGPKIPTKLPKRVLSTMSASMRADAEAVMRKLKGNPAQRKEFLDKMSHEVEKRSARAANRGKEDAASHLEFTQKNLIEYYGGSGSAKPGKGLKAPYYDDGLTPTQAKELRGTLDTILGKGAVIGGVGVTGSKAKQLKDSSSSSSPESEKGAERKSEPAL
ncbi:MAG TPA: hypothetical protein VJB59_12480 [Bdellovibrionota bacterium]|nr:hypothetical protein [Bdellovibrionota bacterium]